MTDLMRMVPRRDLKLARNQQIVASYTDGIQIPQEEVNPESLKALDSKLALVNQYLSSMTSDADRFVELTTKLD